MRERRAVCPGLPSPSGVHLVTHPLHRAQYMTDGGREREQEKEKERESEKMKGREGRESRALTHLHTHTAFSHSMALV